MKRDPVLRADGRCSVCRRERRHAVRNRYSGDQAVYDPFCSATCCRKWHGCTLGAQVTVSSPIPVAA